MTSEQKQKGVAFLKQAGYFGRVANLISQPNQAQISRDPGKTMATRGVTGLAGSVIPGGGLLGIPGEMLTRRMSLGGTPEGRAEALQSSEDQLRSSTMGQNAGSFAGKGALAGSLLGGGLGLGLGALKGYQQGHYDPTEIAQFGGLGLLGGAAGAGLAGAATGAFNKAVQQNTSQDSQDRARDMIARHPYLTSLPFSSFVAGAMS